MIDVAVVGGGPAGLAAAIRCVRRGFRTVCFERQRAPVDKACGEGLMPAGVRELVDLCVLPVGRPFRGIRYVQEDGKAVEGRFADGEGLGVRRLELSRVLAAEAVSRGVQLRDASVLTATHGAASVEVRTDGEAFEARLVIAADGLHSPLRRAAGLEEPSTGPQRFGLRRHFRVERPGDFVEVHWAKGCEAYLTPVGDTCVNVAFLCEKGARFEELLALFPALAQRLQEPVSEVRGAGPLLQRVRRRYADRLALVGDAAGYVDAITGQGLSLAFRAARMLATLLPQDLSLDLTPALSAYDRALRAPWLRYALPAQALVGLSRKPALRRRAIGAAGSLRLFPALLSLVE
ncbi:MAG TPA: NAD(P)/FAD-dependent oxidoreductase [Myxococcales bacterium]